jgi:hypothetical protein
MQHEKLSVQVSQKLCGSKLSLPRPNAPKPQVCWLPQKGPQMLQVFSWDHKV